MKEIRNMTDNELDVLSEAIEDRRKNIATRRIYSVWQQSDVRFKQLSKEKRISLASSVAQVIVVNPVQRNKEELGQMLLDILSGVLDNAI